MNQDRKWSGFMVQYAMVGEPWKFKFCETFEETTKVTKEYQAKKGWLAQFWEL